MSEKLTAEGAALRVASKVMSKFAPDRDYMIHLEFQRELASIVQPALDAACAGLAAEVEKYEHAFAVAQRPGTSAEVMACYDLKLENDQLREALEAIRNISRPPPAQQQVERIIKQALAKAVERATRAPELLRKSGLPEEFRFFLDSVPEEAVIRAVTARLVSSLADGSGAVASWSFGVDIYT